MSFLELRIGNRFAFRILGGVSEAEEAQRILMEKVSAHPALTEDDIGILGAAIQASQERKVDLNLSQREVAILRRNLTVSSDTDEETKAAMIKLGRILDKQEELSYKQESFTPPTLGGRLASFASGLSQINTNTIINRCAGTCFMGIGGLFMGVGLGGEVLTFSNIHQLGLYTIPAAVFSGVITSGGAMIVGIGKEIFSDKH